MRHRLTIATLALILLATHAAPHSALATTLQRFDMEQLTGNAARIFVGRCSSAIPELEHGQIYTRFEFAVESVLKGTEARTIELMLAGGELQGVSYRIVGMPSFRPGERVVLFLTEEDELGHAWPVGLGQGKFIVEDGPDRQPRVYQSLPAGAELVTLSTGTGAAKAAAAALDVNGLRLVDFLALVTDLTSQGTGGSDDR